MLITGAAASGCLIASLHIFFGTARQEDPFFFYAFHIIGLQEDNQNGDGTTWRLVTSDYRCVTITTCYHNPVDKIVAALRQLRPDLPVRRLPNFWPYEKPSNDTTT